MRWRPRRRAAGVEIVTNSAATGVTPDGELTLADGRRIRADLVVAADGSNSRLRDSLGLLSKRKYLVDGCTRLLMDKTAAERAATDGAKTVEYWSGTRRVALHAVQRNRHLYRADDARQR